MTFTPPNEQEIKEIFLRALGRDVISVRRFPTGLAHFVYDVETDLGDFALRVARPDDFGLRAFRAAMYWSDRLRPMGIPMPEIFYDDIEAKHSRFHCYIMERFQGDDLYKVFADMNAAARERLAEQISDIQNKVGTLAPGRGFGCTFTPDDVDVLHASWFDYIARFDELRGRIRKAGVFSEDYVNELEAAMTAHRNYFDQIRPIPFLDDIQGKNIIVNNRHELSGIVDVDEIAYGDRIFNIALTQIALMADQTANPADYIYALCRRADVTAEGREALRLYTMHFCVEFMSEVGHAFNKDAPAPIDCARNEKLREIFVGLRAGN